MLIIASVSYMNFKLIRFSDEPIKRISEGRKKHLMIWWYAVVETINCFDSFVKAVRHPELELAYSAHRTVYDIVRHG